jgi:hypothetical protein
VLKVLPAHLTVTIIKHPTKLEKSWIGLKTIEKCRMHIPVILTPHSGHIDPPEDSVFERTMD